MRYCFSCRKITSGDPSYCNYCGKSYNVKRCGRGHPNVRSADVCSTCGSRDMSVPQARLSLKMRIFQACALTVPYIVLLVLSLAYVGVFFRTLFKDPSGLWPLLLLGMLLSLLWLLWIHLSAMLRELLFGRDRKGYGSSRLDAGTLQSDIHCEFARLPRAVVPEAAPEG